MREPAARRPSLPITAQDEHDLALIRSSPAHREALRRLTELSADPESVSESLLLHAIFRSGLAALLNAVEEEGYARLAAEQVDEQHERKAAARRRTPSWAHEA
jgi:hypothetical protein